MDLLHKTKKEYYFRDTKKTKESFSRSFIYKKINRGVFITITVLLLGFLGGMYAYGYSDIHGIQAVYSINQDNKAEGIRPWENISFRFNLPVNLDQVEKGFNINPAIDGELAFENNLISSYSEKVTFIPSKPFSAETNYTVHFDKLESLFGTTLEDVNFIFRTIKPPEIVGIEPADGSVNTPVKNQILVITENDNPYFFIDFNLDPETIIFVAKTEGGIYKIDSEANLTQGLEYTLHANTYYTPDLNEVNTNNLTDPVRTFSSSFKTIPPVVIESTFPGDNDWILDSMPEISVEFDRTVDYGEAEEHFSITPHIDGRIGWEKNKMIFEPLEDLEKGSTYTYKVEKGVHSYKDTGYLENDHEYSFLAKKTEKSVSPPADLKPAIEEGKYIDLDISDQVMTLFENGKNLDSFQISSGTYGMDTPYGTFKVLNKSPQAFSSQYDLYMPFWMAFTSAGHGIHELPFWRYRSGAEYKERESHLGIRVSHGCVRLGVGPAETVYNWADIGTPVVIHD